MIYESEKTSLARDYCIAEFDIICRRRKKRNAFARVHIDRDLAFDRTSDPRLKTRMFTRDVENSSAVGRLLILLLIIICVITIIVITSVVTTSRSDRYITHVCIFSFFVFTVFAIVIYSHTIFL